MLVHSYHVPQPRPAGVVERLLTFHLDEPDRYVARSYVFGPAKYPDTSRLAVYEGMMPLPPGNVWFTVDLQAYVVRIRASDRTDPRSNGRQYWLVSSPLPTD